MQTKTPSKKSPQEIDRIVGANIRIARLERKMSQTDLARLLGLTFQQVQKYENGANRVNVGRLVQIADSLGMPTIDLFQGTGADGKNRTGEALANLVRDRQTVMLVRAFTGIDDAEMRRSVVKIVGGLAGMAEETA